MAAWPWDPGFHFLTPECCLPFSSSFTCGEVQNFCGLVASHCFRPGQVEDYWPYVVTVVSGRISQMFGTVGWPPQLWATATSIGCLFCCSWGTESLCHGSLPTRLGGAGGDTLSFQETGSSNWLRWWWFYQMFGDARCTLLNIHCCI